MFELNQIVKGHKAGSFVIVGFRSMPGTTERYAQVKEYNPKTGETGRGEFALPFSALKA